MQAEGGVQRGAARRAAGRLYRDRSATTMLEFAVVAPVFLGMLLAGLGVTRLMFIDMMMHNAVVEAARYGSTGAASQSGNGPRMSKILGILNADTGIDAVSSTTSTDTTAAIVLDIKAYQDWSALADGTAASTTYGPAGDENHVVVYSASYQDRLVNRLLAMVAAPAVTITESTIVQNEHSFNMVQGAQ